MSSSGEWSPNFGALRFTTTIAWAQAADWPTNTYLLPQSQFAKWTVQGPPENDPLGIYVFTQPGGVLNDATCPDPSGAELSPGRSVDELISFLQARPGIATSGLADITIDGHAGKVIDLHLQASYTGRCDGPAPAQDYFASTLGADFAFYWVGLTGTQRTRLILLDLGAGDVVGIAIEAGPKTWDAMLQDAMPIIQSFTFE